MESYIQKYNTQNNDQTTENNKNINQQEDINTQKEVNNTPPKIIKEEDLKSNNENIDCSASAKEVLRKLKIYRMSTGSYKRKKIKNLLLKIQEENSNSVNPDLTKLKLAQEFIKNIEICKCQFCNEIKQIDKYDELVNQVEFYTEKNGE